MQTLTPFGPVFIVLVQCLHNNYAILCWLHLSVSEPTCQPAPVSAQCGQYRRSHYNDVIMDDANRSGGHSHQRHRYTIRSFSNDLQVEYCGSGEYALANGSLNNYKLIIIDTHLTESLVWMLTQCNLRLRIKAVMHSCMIVVWK